MTVTIKVNYQTTFQKKEAKNNINERKKERNALLFEFFQDLNGNYK